MMINQTLKNRRFRATYGMKWLKDLQSEVNVTKQEEVDIIEKGFKKILGRVANWNLSSPDLVQGFWLKNVSSCMRE